MKQFLNVPFLKFLSFGKTAKSVIGLVMIPTNGAEVSYEFGSIHTSTRPLQHKITIIVDLSVFFWFFAWSLIVLKRENWKTSPLEAEGPKKWYKKEFSQKPNPFICIF